MAARKVLSGEVDTLPKDTTGVVESIRQLKVARASAIKARSAALLALGDVLISAPAPVREQLSATTGSARATQAARLRPDPARLSEPAQAAKFALRALARQVGDLDQRISEFDAALAPLVAAATPTTMALLGVGTQYAAQLLITIGQNADRIRSEAAFAHLCEVSPLRASSGKTERHRLNHGGDR